MYDIAVIGAGLMGAAALRHLSLAFPQLRVCAIGPAEPAERKTHRGVFASHYDQGRITRVLDPSPLWGQLARESIAQYAQIESASGIRFHHRAGCLRATDLPENTALLDACAEQFAPPHTRLEAAGCREAFPYLRFSDDFTAWDERGEAGYINPRQLAAAQLKAATDKGAHLIRAVVESLSLKSDSVSISTRGGETVSARKVLLCAGGYSNTLLDAKLEMRTKGHTILLAEVGAGEIQRLRNMPAIISSFANPAVASLYMLPPVPYPDGKTYIKLGPSGHPAEPFFDARHDPDALLDWFHSDGLPEVAAHLREALHAMLPGLRVESCHSVPCLITNTAHGNPYIDALDDERVYVTTGGNGYSAKSSDAIGRLGARLCATGEWPSDLDREDFRAVFG